MGHSSPRIRVRQHLLALIAALAQDVKEQNRPLPEVAHIFIQRGRRQLSDPARSGLGGVRTSSGVVAVMAWATASSFQLLAGHGTRRHGSCLVSLAYDSKAFTGA